MTTRVLVFLTIQLFAVFVAWCGGYDFDHRSGSVAYGVAMALVFGMLGAGFPGLGSKK